VNEIGRKFDGLERKVDGLEGTVTAVKDQISGIERQLTGIREQMADNQKVLLAKLNVFIHTQGGINRRVARKLARVQPPRRRRRRG
jgi:hypothetical protein